LYRSDSLEIKKSLIGVLPDPPNSKFPIEIIGIGKEVWFKNPTSKSRFLIQTTIV